MLIFKTIVLCDFKTYMWFNNMETDSDKGNEIRLRGIKEHD